MKKIVLIITGLVLAVMLGACSQAASQTSNQSSLVESSTSLSTATQLLVGTLKLEGTDQAVTSAQAKELLPLWQTLQSLSTSSTAATEEMNALANQIKSTMTADQEARITAMNLTQADVAALMGQKGPIASGTAVSTPMALSGLPAGGNSSTGGSAPSGGMPPSGSAPLGGMPSGGSAPSGSFPQGGTDPASAGGTTGMTTTPQTVRSNGMSDQLPAPLLNSLIELLQKRIQS